MCTRCIISHSCWCNVLINWAAGCRDIRPSDCLGRPSIVITLCMLAQIWNYSYDMDGQWQSIDRSFSGRVSQEGWKTEHMENDCWACGQPMDRGRLMTTATGRCSFVKALVLSVILSLGKIWRGKKSFVHMDRYRLEKVLARSYGLQRHVCGPVSCLSLWLKHWISRNHLSTADLLHG